MLLAFAGKWMSNLPCCDSIVFRSKGVGNMSIHCYADQDTIRIVFRTILKISSVFSEQSQKCVKNLNSFTVERGDVVRGSREFLIRADAGFLNVVEIGQYFMTTLQSSLNAQSRESTFAKRWRTIWTEWDWIHGNTRQNFSWPRLIGHEFERQWAGNFMQFEKYTLKLNAGDFDSRSKGTADA